MYIQLMKIPKTERVIQELASKRKYFCMMQSLVFRLRNITSAYFSVQTWSHRQTICVFMGIKYMYSFYMVRTSNGLLDRSIQLQAVLLRFSTIRI